MSSRVGGAGLGGWPFLFALIIPQSVFIRVHLWLLRQEGLATDEHGLRSKTRLPDAVAPSGDSRRGRLYAWASLFAIGRSDRLLDRRYICVHPCASVATTERKIGHR